MALKRIGVIGDIHAEHTHLESALATLEERRVELVVATGDIADGKGSVDACCELLKAHGVVTVRGNHDRWLLAGTSRDLLDATVLAELSESSRAFLQRLPPMIELSTVQGVALLCHGIGPNDMAKVGPDDFGNAIETNDELQYLLRSGAFRWLINGHSHRRMVRAFPGLTVINAGTLRREHTPGFIEVDFEQGAVFAFEFAADGSIAGPREQPRGLLATAGSSS
jgi:predicted phosphodiesterase